MSLIKLPDIGNCWRTARSLFVLPISCAIGVLTPTPGTAECLPEVGRGLSNMFASGEQRLYIDYVLFADRFEIGRFQGPQRIQVSVPMESVQRIDARGRVIVVAYKCTQSTGHCAIGLLTEPGCDAVSVAKLMKEIYDDGTGGDLDLTF